MKQEPRILKIFCNHKVVDNRIEEMAMIVTVGLEIRQCNLLERQRGLTNSLTEQRPNMKNDLLWRKMTPRYTISVHYVFDIVRF